MKTLFLELALASKRVLSVDPKTLSGGGAPSFTERGLAWLATELTWADGAAYQAWVAQWKAEYRELTEKSRAAKAIMRTKKADRGIYGENYENLAYCAAMDVQRLAGNARGMLALRAYGREVARGVAATRGDIAGMELPTAEAVV